MPALCSQDHACHEEDAVGCSTGSLSRAFLMMLQEGKASYKLFLKSLKG